MSEGKREQICKLYSQIIYTQTWDNWRNDYMKTEWNFGGQIIFMVRINIIDLR